MTETKETLTIEEAVVTVKSFDTMSADACSMMTTAHAVMAVASVIDNLDNTIGYPTKSAVKTDVTNLRRDLLKLIKDLTVMRKGGFIFTGTEGRYFEGILAKKDHLLSSIPDKKTSALERKIAARALLDAEIAALEVEEAVEAAEVKDADFVTPEMVAKATNTEVKAKPKDVK